jgi:hypothetical protein
MATARRRSTRKHQVNVSLQAFDISKAGTSLELEIFARGEKIGDLTLGRGSISWRGRNRQTRKRITWTRFAEMMDELAYGK